MADAGETNHELPDITAKKQIGSSTSKFTRAPARARELAADFNHES